MENWSRKLKKVIWILLMKIIEKNFKGGGNISSKIGIPIFYSFRFPDSEPMIG